PNGEEENQQSMLVQNVRLWMSLHHWSIVGSKDKESEVVFIGDSLVQLMHQCKIWQKLFSPLHTLNFGIGRQNQGVSLPETIT
uniref:Uncharacterized protein n=1 Tax=Felis catus TaxID=9685 RepID=A0ABI7WF47_FELCA